MTLSNERKLRYLRLRKDGADDTTSNGRRYEFVEKPFTLSQVQAFLDLLRANIGVNSDVALAKKVFDEHVSRQTIYRWRYINGIPYRFMVILKRDYPAEFKQVFGDIDA